jgi:hypothetical protein
VNGKAHDGMVVGLYPVSNLAGLNFYDYYYYYFLVITGGYHEFLKLKKTAGGLYETREVVHRHGHDD